MKTVTKRATYLEVDYQPEYGWLTINFGAEIFRSLKNLMYMDATPYADETLVAVRNIAVGDKSFTFESVHKNDDAVFKIQYSKMKGAGELAKLLKTVNESKMDLKGDYDPVSIAVGSDLSIDIDLSIGDNKNRLLICDNQYRRTIDKRFPEPSEEYDLKSIRVEDGCLFVDTKDGVELTWTFNLPRPIQDCLTSLIEIWLQKTYP